MNVDRRSGVAAKVGLSTMPRRRNSCTLAGHRNAQNLCRLSPRAPEFFEIAVTCRRTFVCIVRDHEAAKRFVYVLKNEGNPARYYTGITSDVRIRLDAHNAGRCPHTASGKPWIVDIVVEFSDEHRALAFERYLKSGSGTAFAKRHFR